MHHLCKPSEEGTGKVPFGRPPISAFVHEFEVEGPATHVFLVGLSDYPHLNGGSGKLARWDFDLGQLSSPSASARALANWFATDFECRHAPLATISLVLSEGGADQATYIKPSTSRTFKVPRGTKAEIRSALLRTLERARPDDQLIFYFAGHGVSAGSNDFYLLRDFGEDPDDPLGSMLNYSLFMAAMDSERPSRQFFVFDACRDIDRRAEANTGGGSGLLTADPARRLGLEPVLQCSVKSTEKDGRAYGKINEPSICAQAYLRAVAGAAGKRSVDGWEVTTGRMCEALKDLQSLDFGFNAGIRQHSDPARYRDFAIRGLLTPPKIPVFLRRKDGASLTGATLRYGTVGGDREKRDQAKLAGAYWEGLLDMGEYEFEVEVEPSRFLPPVSDFVTPTHLPLEVPVR